MGFSSQLQQKKASASSRIDALWSSWLCLPRQSEISPDNSMENSSEVTQLLLAWRNGDAQALDRLTPLVYDELRRLAGRYLRHERTEHTLQATALVNEAYWQLIGQQPIDWQSRAHFIGIAARLMHNILVDHARARAAAKRGQGAGALPLDEAKTVAHPTAPDLLALDDAMQDLAKFDERKSRMIELRYFGGLSMEEIAEVTNLSTATIRRDLRMAEAWLGRQMKKQ